MVSLMGWGKRALRVSIEVVGGEEGGVWKVSMKIITYNARGLGGGEKRVEVRRLVQDKRPMVLFIQENKLKISSRLFGEKECIIFLINCPLGRLGYGHGVGRVPN